MLVFKWYRCVHCFGIKLRETRIKQKQTGQARRAVQINDKSAKMILEGKRAEAAKKRAEEAKEAAKKAEEAAQKHAEAAKEDREQKWGHSELGKPPKASVKQHKQANNQARDARQQQRDQRHAAAQPPPPPPRQWGQDVKEQR